MPTATLQPSRPTPGSPNSNRTTRVVITVIAAVCVLLGVAGLTFGTVGSAIARSNYDEVPAQYTVGTPEDLTIKSDRSNVRVLISESADQIELGLVESGSTTLPSAQDTVMARWEESPSAEGSGVTVELSRPGFRGNIGWAYEEGHELLAVIPQDLTDSLALNVESDVGNVDVSGSFEELKVRSDVGNINLNSVATEQTLIAQNRVGQVDVQIADNHRGDVTASSNVGEVNVLLPCCDGWSVRASTDVGNSYVDSSLTRTEGPLVDVSSQVGDVSVERN